MKLIDNFPLFKEWYTYVYFQKKWKFKDLIQTMNSWLMSGLMSGCVGLFFLLFILFNYYYLFFLEFPEKRKLTFTGRE